MISINSILIHMPFIIIRAHTIAVTIVVIVQIVRNLVLHDSIEILILARSNTSFNRVKPNWIQIDSFGIYRWVEAAALANS